MIGDFTPVWLEDHFEIGMDRKLSWQQPMIDRGESIRVNLGAGEKSIEGFLPLDAERGWFAGSQMPYEDGDVVEFVAYHFFEHLDKAEIIATLREIERCLAVGGTLTCVTPHYTSEAAHQDLDHKSTWTESTWRNLFKNQYYKGTMPREWKLKEVQSIIMGLNMRNLVIVSQLERIS